MGIRFETKDASYHGKSEFANGEVVGHVRMFTRDLPATAAADSLRRYPSPNGHYVEGICKAIQGGARLVDGGGSLNMPGAHLADGKPVSLLDHDAQSYRDGTISHFRDKPARK